MAKRTTCVPFYLASGGVCNDAPCHQRTGRLLPCHFNLTTKVAVYFLLYFPWGHPHLPLASTLFCDARTFLVYFCPRSSGWLCCIISQKNFLSSIAEKSQDFAWLLFIMSLLFLQIYICPYMHNHILMFQHHKYLFLCIDLVDLWEHRVQVFQIFHHQPICQDQSFCQICK